MMKLAYRVFVVTLFLFTLVLASFAQTDDKNRRSAKDDRNTAPTVGTGGPVGGPTGLFTVYDGQTLRTGEYTFSAAYSNYDRDPGNADIVEVPVSFQVGITDNIELFFNTDAFRAIKINSPRNLSSFYLPNSQLRFGALLTSGGAIILAPSGPGTGSLEGRAVYRPIGTQPFVQFPYIGGSAGNFGLLFSGPPFGYPAGTNALISTPTIGGGASNFPGLGSIYGSILPGIVLQTACSSGAATCANAATVPTIFTTAPSYLNDAPFINRTYGTSSFSTFTAGAKFRLNSVNDKIGYGVIAAYRWFADSADDFAGFNQMQRGASPGGSFTRGDILVTGFADWRLKKWANLSANVGFHYNSSVKGDFPGGRFTLLDRPNELLASIGADFPVNKFFQPILEFRSLQYVGGRTPNAFENHPMDGIAGVRIFPARWVGFGFAYRYHFNQQDRDSFSDEDENSSSVLVPCNTTSTNCVPFTITTRYTGIPPGFQPSSDPHGFIVQAFIGRRDKRQEEIENKFANVTGLTLSDTEIKGGCEPGFAPREGQVCNESSSISVTTTAVDPENDVLTYNYTVSGGRIVGSGANVSWDLGGVAPGTYTITAGVDDGCGLCGKTETRTVTVAACDCVKVCECPSLSISGPAGVTNPGDAMTFTATASGGTQQSVTYNWTVTSGTIESGQGTPSISVRTTREMAGTSVTATVSLGGFDPGCICDRSASETGGIAPPVTPEMVDEFGKLPNDEIRGRLDTFFATLSNNPTDQGYIINYGTDREVAARERLIRNHIAFRKFDASRITLVNGGASADGEVRTKLYRIPPGADNPTP